MSFRRGHRYLTLVVDHDTGRIVWASEGARAKGSLDGWWCADFCVSDLVRPVGS